MEWKVYVQELIAQIRRISGTAIVGVYGCHYKSDYRKCKEYNRLRVYVNGGAAFQIPLKSKVFQFADDYMKEPYLDKDTIERINKIMKAVRENPFKFRDNDFALLREYLNYMQKATHDKFGELLSGKNGSSKEREYQVKLYKQLVVDKPRSVNAQ